MTEKIRILIVDDDADAMTMLVHRLKADGYGTLSAGEGVRAIEVAHKQHPDLILLDVRMPAGDGATVLQALQSAPDTQDIPIIAMTAYSSENLKAEMLGAGARAFFEKPYDINELMHEIHDQLPLL